MGKGSIHRQPHPGDIKPGSGEYRHDGGTCQQDKRYLHFCLDHPDKTSAAI